LNVLFSAGHFGFLRNFESTLRLLGTRGHRVHLVADRRDQTEGQRMVDALLADYPAFSAEVLPFSKQRAWYPLGTGLRATLDYWRYLQPSYDQSPELRGRALKQAPRAAVAARALRAVAAGAVHRIEQAIPVRPEVEALFDRIAPDVLVLTPLLYFGSQQPDYVRAARARGIPSVLCVGSWDHLTTKGLIHEIPDRVVVWNEAQRDEAWRFHRVPASRVVVTGAQAYDHWFAARASSTRAEFCARTGLAADRPFLLYLCSSPFIAPHEVPFVRRWMAAIRASSHPVLREAGLLVRPHPQNAAQWQGVELEREFANAAVWPKAGANPVHAAARADYFDSMFHSRAVVGVNTSALIESGIVGRPVYSVSAGDFAATQEGTLHFQHLKHVNGGLLHLASDLDAHTAELAALFDAGDVAAGPRAFVEAFVRPFGIDSPATPRVVEAIEAAAALRLVPRPVTPGQRLLQRALAPVAAGVQQWQRAQRAKS
jgi:hypothetical protein